MTAVPFPILRLPESALQKSVQLFDVVEKLSLSVLSKNTKQLITALNKEPIKSYVSIKSSNILLRLFDRSDQQFKMTLNSDQSNLVIRKDSNTHYKFELNAPGFAEKQWFKHISEVLSKNKFTYLNIENSAGRSIDKINELTKGLNIWEVRVEYSHIQDYELYKLFPSKLSVYSLDLIPKSILTHRLERLELFRMDVKLDDFLALNYSHFEVCAQNFYNNDVNLFLKHWIKGANPNLEHLTLTRSNHEQEFNDDIFKGIEGVIIEQRGFKGFDMFARKFELKRHDGTKALVFFYFRSFISFYYCQLIVFVLFL